MSYSARIALMMPPEHIPQLVASASFTGFKCARHAAAEIAAEADATIAALQRELEEDQGVIRVWRGRAERADATIAELVAALETAEAALADVGDADREPGDDVAWREARTAKALPAARAALAKVKEQA
jgi:uncharacterized protein YukE